MKEIFATFSKNLIDLAFIRHQQEIETTFNIGGWKLNIDGIQKPKRRREVRNKIDLEEFHVARTQGSRQCLLEVWKIKRPPRKKNATLSRKPPRRIQNSLPHKNPYLEKKSFLLLIFNFQNINNHHMFLSYLICSK